jgi:hypothetical protein
LRRYYALLLCSDQHLRLIKALDGDHTLAETPLGWQLGETYELALEASGTSLRAYLNGKQIFTVDDPTRPLTGGGVALVCEEGRVATDQVSVQPVGSA